MRKRDWFIIGVAVLIDALQAVLAWVAFVVGLSLQAITPAGGAAAGAAAGAYACFNSSTGIVSAVIAAGKCAVGGALIGAAASTFGVPLGAALGFGLEIAISLTLGSAFILLLVLNDMYYPTRILSGFFIELIPGLDILPGWTFMAILCVMRKNAEKGELVGKASTNLANMVARDTPLGTAVSGIKAIQQKTVGMQLSAGAVSQEDYKQARIDSRQHLKVELQNIDGIKPVPINPRGKNQPYVQKAA